MSGGLESELASVELVGADEVIDRVGVVDPAAIPGALVGLRRDPEIHVVGQDRVPSGAFDAHRRRDVEHQPAQLVAELRPITAELDLVSVLVNKTVVMTANTNRIIDLGIATVGPVVDMMTFQEYTV